VGTITERGPADRQFYHRVVVTAGIVPVRAMDRENPFEEIERLFDQFSTQSEPGAGLGGSVAVDVADAGDAFEVTADLPGYTSEDIEVTLPDPRTLRINATQETAEQGEDDRRYVRQERSRRTSRTVSLPDRIDEGGAEASYENGVLTVRLPKRDVDEGTDIPVN